MGNATYEGMLPAGHRAARTTVTFFFVSRRPEEKGDWNGAGEVTEEAERGLEEQKPGDGDNDE